MHVFAHGGRKTLTKREASARVVFPRDQGAKGYQGRPRVFKAQDSLDSPDSRVEKFRVAAAYVM